MTRPGLYAGLALAAAFVAGIAASAAFNRRPPRAGGVAVRMSMNAAALFLRRADALDPLALNPDQRRHIDSVLLANRDRAERMMERLRDDVQALTDSTRQSIRSVLDEAQRTRLDSVLAAAQPVRMRSPVPPPAAPRESTPHD